MLLFHHPHHHNSDELIVTPGSRNVYGAVSRAQNQNAAFGFQFWRSESTFWGIVQTELSSPSPGGGHRADERPRDEQNQLLGRERELPFPES